VLDCQASVFVGLLMQWYDLTGEHPTPPSTPEAEREVSRVGGKRKVMWMASSACDSPIVGSVGGDSSSKRSRTPTGASATASATENPLEMEPTWVSTHNSHFVECRLIATAGKMEYLIVILPMQKPEFQALVHHAIEQSANLK
jgi:hypothetical protein